MPDWEKGIPEFIAALMRGTLGLKLGPGVLGTIIPINTVGMLAIAITAWSLSGNPLAAVIAVAMGVSFLVYANERAFRYALRHPLPALLSGGQMLEFFRDQAAAKDKTIVVEHEPIAATLDSKESQ